MRLFPENLPYKDSPSWTLWKKETRDGKPAKVPYQADGKRAKSDDASTWRKFDTVYMAYQDIGGFDGICWMMPVEPSSVIFIDIDHCINDGKIEPWAQKVIDDFDSYTEISQSCNGLHILIQGKKPIVRCRKHGSPYEIYDSLRPCYLTGDVVEGRMTIEARQEPLNRLFNEIFSEETERSNEPQKKVTPGRSSLSDEAVILKATLAKNGTEFKSLYDGVTLGYGGDDSAADMALMNRLAFWTGGDPAQMERIFSSSSLGRRAKWRDRADYRERTVRKAISDSREFYEPPKNRCDGCSYRPDEAGISINLEELTEGGNASRLERLCGNELRFCHTFAKWYIWQGGRWKIDINGGANRIAAKVVNALYDEAANADGKDERRAIAKFAKETDSRRGISNMLALAGSRLTFAITADKLDSDAWILGSEDVTFDLKTGSTREPCRTDLVTKAIGTRYDSAATCPLWLKFLDRVFACDADLISYVKRAFGYCLTGSMADQVFFFCHGSGSNGKSKFLAVLRGLLGDYAKQADFSTFLVQRNEKVRNDLAALAGARVITATEAEEGSRLSMAVIKSWTGGDPVTARFLFGENFTFQPTGKLWLAANNKPAISERNHAAWRRVQLVPFNVTIPDQEQDRDLQSKLLKELPGILNWALEGLADYLKVGLKTPDAVKLATAKYRQENDSLEEFLSECCDIAKVSTCKNIDLYGAYQNFCGMSGLSVLSQTKFSPELNQRPGIKSTRTMYGVTWIGIDLKKNWKFGGNEDQTLHACRVDEPLHSSTGDVKHVELGKNAQSLDDSFLRENLAQNPTYPSYPTSNVVIDADFQKTNPSSACRVGVGEKGPTMSKIDKPTPTKKIADDPGFLKFKAGMKKRTCCLCGRSFPYDLTPYFNEGKSGYICTTCHMQGPPTETQEPEKSDSQTKLDEAQAA